jgi:membrane protein required for colicin V production
MSVFDIIILVIIGVFCVKGLIRGLILEILTLAGLLVGYWVALKEMSVGAAWLTEILQIPDWIANTMSFILIFLVIVIVFRILAGAIRKLIKWTLLGWLDKGGGILIGLFKGALIASLAMLLVSVIPLPEKTEKQKEKSFLYKPVSEVAPAVFNIIKVAFPKTKDFYEEIKEGFTDTAEEAVGDALKNEIKKLQKEAEDRINN